MRLVGIFLQKAEMVQHRVIGRKIHLADHADGVVTGLHARKLNAGVWMKQLAAGQIAKKIEVPPGAAELTVGRKLEADRGLLVHDLLDLHVLDLAQLFGGNIALFELGARFLDFRWPEQAADLVGAERRLCSLHGSAPETFLQCAAAPETPR